MNDLKQTFVILKQRISLNNNLEEMDINQFKGYFHYKTIFWNKVALDVWLITFLFEGKIMFCSWYI